MSSITFIIELYLASYIPLIFYQKFTTTTFITQTAFSIFKYLYLVCNFICLLNFVLNIFDVNLTEYNDDNVGGSTTINTTDTYDPE